LLHQRSSEVDRQGRSEHVSAAEINARLMIQVLKAAWPE
jgi:hypothetical protein